MKDDIKVGDVFAYRYKVSYRIKSIYTTKVISVTPKQFTIKLAAGEYIVRKKDMKVLGTRRNNMYLEKITPEIKEEIELEDLRESVSDIIYDINQEYSNDTFKNIPKEDLLKIKEVLSIFTSKESN